MGINLNRTLPAAPAGSTNVKWQSDVSGNVSGYVSASASTLPPTDQTGQTADIPPTTVLAVIASGRYRISGYIVVTTPDGASSTLPKITITWTDSDSTGAMSKDITATQTGNAATTFDQGDVIVNATTATNIQYATSGYASGTPATMQYAVHIIVEQF